MHRASGRIQQELRGSGGKEHDPPRGESQEGISQPGEQGRAAVNRKGVKQEVKEIRLKLILSMMVGSDLFRSFYRRKHK